MLFVHNYYKEYEKINQCYISFLTNNSSKFNIDKKSRKLLNKYNKSYDPTINEKIKRYADNINFENFKEIFYERFKFFKPLSTKDFNFLDSYIKNNISYYSIDKHSLLYFNISKLENDSLFSKYKNDIVFHFDTKIKGYRTIYLPISKKCHIFGNYSNQLKDIVFLFHELGHCYQMLITNKIFKDYTKAEIFACLNEIIMAKKFKFQNFTIKLINNKILESFAMYRMYYFLGNNNLSNIEQIEKKWKEICTEYNIYYKEKRWMKDLNCLENPHHILTYTISYLFTLNSKDKTSEEFENLYSKLKFSKNLIKQLKKEL